MDQLINHVSTIIHHYGLSDQRLQSELRQLVNQCLPCVNQCLPDTQS